MALDFGDMGSDRQSYTERDTVLKLVGSSSYPDLMNDPMFCISVKYIDIMSLGRLQVGRAVEMIQKSENKGGPATAADTVRNS